jgi:methylated-DNA-[protein]-cysteine S-methyltransferase
VSVLAYAPVVSPLGRLVVAVSPDGLARVVLPTEDAEAVVAATAAARGLRPSESPRRLAPVARELREYFAGRRRAFTVPLDLFGATGFRRTLLERMAELEYGETVTYTELAARAGNPRAARAAGHACATNPIPIVVPCHRVLRSDGGLGGYASGLEHKRFLLQLERVH